LTQIRYERPRCGGRNATHAREREREHERE
jgi:hypothetical protein